MVVKKKIKSVEKQLEDLEAEINLLTLQVTDKQFKLCLSLASGMDKSKALAKSDYSDPKQSYYNTVIRSKKVSKLLRLMKQRYAISHGMTDEQRYTHVQDVLKMAKSKGDARSTIQALRLEAELAGRINQDNPGGNGGVTIVVNSGIVREVQEELPLVTGITIEGDPEEIDPRDML